MVNAISKGKVKFQDIVVVEHFLDHTVGGWSCSHSTRPQDRHRERDPKPADWHYSDDISILPSMWPVSWGKQLQIDSYYGIELSPSDLYHKERGVCSSCGKWKPISYRSVPIWPCETPFSEATCCELPVLSCDPKVFRRVVLKEYCALHLAADTIIM